MKCEDEKVDYLTRTIQKAKESAIDNMSDIIKQVTKDNQSHNLAPNDWLNLLLKRLSVETVAETSGRIGTVHDVQAVARRLTTELQQNCNYELDEEPISFLSKLKFTPIEELTKEKFGCTEQCPFCGVSCDNGFVCDGVNRKHTTERHRPMGFTGNN